MAIAFDAVSEGAEVSGAASTSWSHACTGAQRALLVVVLVRHNSLANGVPTGVTYNGVAMSMEVSQGNANAVTDFGSGPIVSIWSLINPASGENTVEITWPENISSVAAPCAISLTGVDQSDCVEAVGANPGSGAAATVSATTVTADAWVIDGLYHLAAGAPSAGSGQVPRSARQVLGAASQDGVGASTIGPIASPGSTAMDWTASADAYWSAASVVVKPAADQEPEVEPEATQKAAGRSRRKRRYFVDIDGQEFEVSGLGEAEELLAKAKSVAVEHIQKARTTPVRVGHGISRPRITTRSPELRPIVAQARKEITSLYDSAIRDLEIAVLMAKAEEEEEEALIRLLM